jgi:hypothetical protein
LDWGALEAIILDDYRTKSPLYMDRIKLPDDETLSWLALMQHYGVPTRLLDFTYSPYVALYFALRNSRGHEGNSPVSIWGIDGYAVRRRAEQVYREATSLPAQPPISFTDFATARDTLVIHRDRTRKMLEDALTAKGELRNVFDRRGFVAVALPPTENIRLSSQQGVFLFNGAEHLTFKQSLDKMMENHTDTWSKVFKIPRGLFPEIEQHLFRMNVHELSLFPDVEGLAAFIRQKVRLIYGPNRS